MSFKEDFPSLPQDGRLYQSYDIMDACLDKQKVKDAISPKKVDEYLNLLHTQPSDLKFSEEYRRGWMAAGSELAYTIKEELNLE